MLNYQQEAQDRAEARLPISALRGLYRKESRAEQLLGPEGPISRSLPGYQPRPAQLRLSAEIEFAWKNNRCLVAEAGTGTGKSLAYLVPALQSGKKVLVATATKALQAQLIGDLEFLQRHSGIEFTWAVQTGKANYACEQAMSGTPPLGFDSTIEKIQEWLAETQTGNLGELEFDIYQPAYRDIRPLYVVQDDDCAGRKCRYAKAGECWYYRARERAEQADILVVNHAILVLDLVLGGQLLPAYDYAVIDEAHQFEEYTRSALEVEITEHRVRSIAKRGAKLLGSDRIREHAETIEVSAKVLFTALGDVVRTLLKNRPGETALTPMLLGDDVMQLVEGLRDELGTFWQAIRAEWIPDGSLEGEAKSVKLENLRQSLSSLSSDLRSLGEEDPGTVLWAQLEKLEFRPKILRTPISVAEFLREYLWEHTPAVLTSATIAVGVGEGAFGHLRDALGLPNDTMELQVESPFDYRSQMRYVCSGLPEDVVSPKKVWRQEERTAIWADAIAPIIEAGILASQGDALILFTSFSVLDAVAERLRGLPFPMRTQRDGTKGALIDWLRNTEGSVLFATGSFWEGVNIPGDALRLVALDKIPFRPPHPVEDAIQERIGRDAFFRRAVPMATTTLKQGVGRLIRQEVDRGVIMLLDPRFVTKPYGRRILRSLPGQPLPPAMNDYSERAGNYSLLPEDLSSIQDWLRNGGAL